MRNNRRDFLKAVALGSVGAGSLLLNNSMQIKAAAPDKIDAHTGRCGMINYFDKGTPLTISMWDFSWLLGHHKVGPYENLARCRLAQKHQSVYYGNDQGIR